MTTTQSTRPQLTTVWRRADSLQPGDRFLDSERTERQVISVTPVAHPVDNGLDLVVLHTRTSSHPFAAWKNVPVYVLR